MKNSSINVLLVEDDRVYAKIVTRMLRELGEYVEKVEHAELLADALAMLAAGTFDVVLLDLNLPDSAGLRGLEKVIARNPKIPVILLTGMDDEILGTKALQMRAADYLVKGQVNGSLLVRSIRYAVERKQIEELLRLEKDIFENQVKERSQDLLDAQQALERSRRLSDIGTLAAIVAHELRNPLAAIAMAATNIKRKADNPHLEKHLRNIDKKVTESNQIINNLLFYSRLRTPQYEKVDLRAVIEECAGTEHGLASRKGVQVELALPASLQIEADPLQMKEVFSNLLGNAFDAVNPASGKIRVSADGGEAAVRITVADTGKGIDRELQEKIFEPFFTTKAKGTGLGLCVCRQIATLHGGAISIDSVPGKGTAVSVSLPRSPQKWQRKRS